MISCIFFRQLFQGKSKQIKEGGRFLFDVLNRDVKLLLPTGFFLLVLRSVLALEGGNGTKKTNYSC